ncbi:DpnD/PcfM family protein [Psychrobacter sp. KCTC 72983]|uniref:DpnD/PcfM family protein n=1 Tax=Psychrobacter sp. KCTC 72983 TaxID=2733866 RepID=UPI001646661D|nr:DpnD/PcfM family protein [Psychrobacter sp. KCTC 72983]
MIKTGGSNTYQIEVIETMSALIEVVAEDGETALLKTREMYRSEDIILEPDDMLDTEFIIFGVEENE